MTRNAVSMLGNRPAASRSMMVPGPSHDAEDAILKARQGALNTAPFTNEHMAAYAAFAGIIDRKVALELHRHRVTWDDVNDYPRAGDVDTTDFHTMKILGQAGVTPPAFAAWTEMGVRHTSLVTIDDVVVLANAGVTVEQVEPFHATAAASPNVRWAAADIVAFLHGNLTPQTARDYTQAGIRTASTAVYLHGKGCTPATVTSHQVATREPVNPTTFERTFTSLYIGFAKAIDRPALVRVAVSNNAHVTETLAWDVTGESLKKVDLYMKARVSADEWNNDPTVRDVDEATLAMLSALHGTTVAA